MKAKIRIKSNWGLITNDYINHFNKLQPWHRFILDDLAQGLVSLSAYIALTGRHVKGIDDTLNEFEFTDIYIDRDIITDRESRKLKQYKEKIDQLEQQSMDYKSVLDKFDILMHQASMYLDIIIDLDFLKAVDSINIIVDTSDPTIEEVLDWWLSNKELPSINKVRTGLYLYTNPTSKNENN